LVPASVAAVRYRYRILYSEAGPIGICYEAEGRIHFDFTKAYWLYTPRWSFWERYEPLHTMSLEDVAGGDLYEEVRAAHLALLFGEAHLSPELGRREDTRGRLTVHRWFKARLFEMAGLPVRWGPLPDYL
jgi:hypothetical protein